MRLPVVFLALLVAIASTYAGQQEPNKTDISGIVVAATGEPIADVRVYGSDSCKYCCPCKREETKTSADGTFSLPAPGKVLYFRHLKFRPVSLPVESWPEGMQVILEAASLSNWKIPDCLASQASGKRVGEFFVQFLISKGAKTKRSAGMDGWGWLIKHPRRPHRMKIDEGPLLGGGDPGEDLIMDSSQVEERWVTTISSGPLGIDARGRFKDGTIWRHVGVLGVQYAEYRSAPGDAAEFFDKIIDSACAAEPR
jgi:hypothetical protein